MNLSHIPPPSLSPSLSWASYNTKGKTKKTISPYSL